MFGVNRAYVSEFAQWMQQEQSGHPEWAVDRQGSRALWWDRELNFLAEADSASAVILQKPYPYDVNFDQS